MSENTKPAADDTNETPEVEAHSVLDLQETAVNADRDIIAPPGNCIQRAERRRELIPAGRTPRRDPRGLRSSR
ncbi:hypothetical protein RB201_13270 [Streptomyces sp. S1A(2023)]